MILYFTNNLYTILGTASTNLPDPKGLHIIDDRRTEEIGSGFDTYEYTITYDYAQRSEAEKILACGNYIFRKSCMDDQFTAAVIIESETDPLSLTISISSEDVGLDLLNGLADAYSPSTAKGIGEYVGHFLENTGYQIGLNEFSNDYILALSWDSASTITERLLDIAKYFEAEIYCSFEIDGFWIRNRKVNIVRERGKDIGAELREGIHLTNVVVKRDMTDVATALNAIGSYDSDNSESITLRGYTYDDGDFYVDGTLLKSREALKRWSRDMSTSSTTFGHIIRTFECEAGTQEQLFRETLKELKKVRDLSIQYEADVLELPSNVRIGDTVRIVDRAGELYLSARVLKLESSEVAGTRSATFGNYKVIGSGLNPTITKLATEIRKRTEEMEASKALAVTSVTTYYATKTGSTPPEPTSSEWRTTAVDQRQGEHVWQMVVTMYGNGTKTYTITDVTTIATALNVQTFYAVRETDASAPSKPVDATTLPPTGWSFQEPDSEGILGDVYSTTLITYSDGTWVYSDPVKITSYKAISDAIDETDQKAEDAKNAAEDAKSTAEDVKQSFENYEETVAELNAKLTEKGFTVEDLNSGKETRLDSTGLRIVQDGIVIAQFDNKNSYVDYLKVNTFLSFGSHRAQTMTMTEYDGTSQPKGTGFFWTGGE